MVDAQRRRRNLRAASCQKAFDAAPSNTELKVAVARNLPYARKTEAIAMLREAAALARRARRDRCADRAEALLKRPVSGSARSL
jgi:hypothetical protein